MAGEPSLPVECGVNARDAAHVVRPCVARRGELDVVPGPFGVADLLIPEGAELLGKTIQESGLRDRDIVILNLVRGVTVISNPKTSRTLEAGDKLLCYGKLDAMRSMIPQRRTSQRKKVKRLDPAPLEQL